MEFARGWRGSNTDLVLKYLHFSEEMDFGASVEGSLINEFSVSFFTIHTCKDFLSLSPKIQILAARKRLWLLLRKLDTEVRSVLLDEEGYGLLSIFEGQPVSNFQYNNSETTYIKE